jgi:D-arabinose 1-dehydrogenase-like Zn-dependent alcohol dehydrogenase
MTTSRAVQVTGPGGPFQLIEREVPSPSEGEVRVRVQACGICHSDVLVKDGIIPGLPYPRVPGHEVAGVVDALGAGVDNWQVGQRVGIGWHGGYCGKCEPCRRGNFFACVWQQITGLTRDGGYADHVIAHHSALALIPDELTPIEAAPLVCAGITCFNALRNSGARAGDTVAILGLGGLGHLGVQFAVKMGFRTVAIARGVEKEPLARQLGAHHYIDSKTKDVAAELTKLGGAKVVLATVTNADAMTSTIGGLGPNGKLLVLGAPPEPLPVSALALITSRKSVDGWYSGTSIDSQDTMTFSELSGVRAMTEVFPLEKAAEGYERMISGGARFRVVLDVSGN